MTLFEALSAISLTSLPEELCCKEVFEIDHKTPILDAFQMLAERFYLSAPVYDKEKNQYNGFLDVRDCVSFVVFANKLDSRLTLKEIVHNASLMYNQSLEDLSPSYMAKRNKWLPVKLNGGHMGEVMRNLAQGAKRVPVMNDEGRCVNVISSSAVIKFIESYREPLGLDASFLSKKINEIGLGSGPVLCVSRSASAFSAFQLMDKKHLNGLGVINEEGTLVGNTSARDLKRYLKYNEPLAQPIGDFLNKIRQENTKATYPIVTVASDAPLSKVVAKMAATRMHRIFTTDNRGKAETVITVNDVVRYLSKV